MSFAAGIGAGIAVGISTGFATGKKKTIDTLREYCEEKGITVRNRDGAEIAVDKFLDEVFAQESHKRIWLIVAVLAGIFVLLGVAFFFFKG